MLRVEGRLDEALEHGLQATKEAPDDPDAHYNLGLVRHDRGELAEAEASLRRALALAPEHAGAHFELAETLLLGGTFTEGWDEYEWRYKIPGAAATTPPTDKPFWRGEPMAGETLLLVADQGFGDVIQFMRYIPRVAALCPARAIACSAEMEPLVAQLSGDARLFSLWRDAPAFDRYCTFSSLPRLFGARLGAIEASVPYLHADPARLDHWQQRLRSMTPMGYRRIGLVWAGRPAHGNDRNRSIRLHQLAPLGALDKTVLVSLQLGEAAVQAGGYYGAAPLLNLGPEIRDFRDTAALLQTLDLLVTVDTAAAHLAGALGRPAAVLLPFAPDWRWLRDRNDSPWYPTLRLYRQARAGDWNDVVARLVDDLHHNGFSHRR